jgi:hypothetical protein
MTRHTATHPHHGAILSELRSLGFATRMRASLNGHGHSAILHTGTTTIVALIPTDHADGWLVDFTRTNRGIHENAIRKAAAPCFLDMVRTHVTGGDTSRMHNADCWCVLDA